MFVSFLGSGESRPVVISYNFCFACDVHRRSGRGAACWGTTARGSRPRRHTSWWTPGVRVAQNLTLVDFLVARLSEGTLLLLESGPDDPRFLVLSPYLGDAHGPLSASYHGGPGLASPILVENEMARVRGSCVRSVTAHRRAPSPGP